MAGEGSGGGSAQPPGVLGPNAPRLPAGPMVLLPGGEHRPRLLGRTVRAASPCSELALFQPVNVVGELERGPQLQTHVLHHHVTAQQQEGLAVDLLQGGGRRGRQRLL